MNDIRVIMLGGKRGGFTIVDADDFPELSRFKWTLCRRYVTRSYREDGKSKNIYMHRQILGATHGVKCDHKNHHRTDNTRRNLRLATAFENARNTRKQHTQTSSRFKGVSWDKRKKRWRAQIIVNYRRIKLGGFRDEVEAAIAYNHAALKHHGEFACLNPI